MKDRLIFSRRRQNTPCHHPAKPLLIAAIASLLISSLNASAESSRQISWEAQPIRTSASVDLTIVIPERLVMATNPIFQKTAQEAGWSGLAFPQHRTASDGTAAQTADQETTPSFRNQTQFFHNLPGNAWVAESYRNADNGRTIYAIAHP